MEKEEDIHLPSDFSTEGCTALVVIHIKNILFFVNLGDSRAILVNNKGNILKETIDHKSENAIERKRIEEQNDGQIIKEFYQGKAIYRIEHSGGFSLSVSRAFGYFSFKIKKEDVEINIKTKNKKIKNV